MKREYVKPMMVGEQFVPNEYIAACGETNKVYKFKCDAKQVGFAGYVAEETNNIPGYQSPLDPDNSNPDTLLTVSYHQCGATHEARVTDDFVDGYFRASVFNEIVPVIIWKGKNDDNVHCTTNIRKEEWETTKS